MEFGVYPLPTNVQIGSVLGSEDRPLDGEIDIDGVVLGAVVGGEVVVGGGGVSTTCACAVAGVVP